MADNILCNLTTIKDGAGLILAAVIAGLSNLIGVQGPELNFLLVLMAADYISGLIVAGVFKKSRKSCDGALDSRAGIKGLFRKGWMLFIIYMCAQLDILFDTGYAASMMVYFFILNESLSILENGGLMGVRYPNALKNALEALSKKGEEKK
ncbi:MAG: phage holin family protein [Eubacteriales bacterium]|nr:phage holin family protein [Eubacteriales bacterium]